MAAADMRRFILYVGIPNTALDVACGQVLQSAPELASQVAVVHVKPELHPTMPAQVTRPGGTPVLLDRSAQQFATPGNVTLQLLVKLGAQAKHMGQRAPVTRPHSYYPGPAAHAAPPSFASAAPQPAATPPQPVEYGGFGTPGGHISYSRPGFSIGSTADFSPQACVTMDPTRAQALLDANFGSQGVSKPTTDKPIPQIQADTTKLKTTDGDAIDEMRKQQDAMIQARIQARKASGGGGR